MADELHSIDFQHALVLQAWDCLIGEGKVTYISGPITTGLRWVEAVEGGADAGKPVIEANCEAIRQAASYMRHVTGGLVLEPASLHVETWSQDDYLALWMTVIERHASTVAFVDGWSYSIGCAHEFERAVIHRIPTIAVDENPISLDSGIDMLAQAVAALSKNKDNNAKVQGLADKLSVVMRRLENIKSIKTSK